ncbi:MAG: PAS domain-containing protein, partial [Burkholderiaceae bacterium]|nr:PAS domain-containing protein [Burkholderiaceae bacterium]
MDETISSNVRQSGAVDDPEPGSDSMALPWLVAVGASAGGLEALQRFFSAVRRPTQAAFIVVQHLAPDHRSMMPELLARHTELPVQEACAGEQLQPDRVYLMPAGVLMTLEHEQLVFAPRPLQGVSLPIDQFIRSLSQVLAGRSIGVVLSGSGSDGAAGVALLRSAGGYVMAQAPETAKFDSMPRSAIAAAPMDAVLPPEGLAERVLLITRGKAGRLANGQLIGVVSAKPALQRLFEAMHARFGVDFSHYKLPTMMRRIERRMAVLGCTSVSDFADKLGQSDEECELLRQELLIPVTSFFRDPAAFEALGVALGALLRERPAQQPFRIWCAGCATGEEAYSLAILALEACHAVQRWPGIKVFATDVDPGVLAVGSAGIYPKGAAEGLTPERLAQHFTVSEDRIMVRPELRQQVLFAKHNLLEDAPFTKVDLVVCRNTLIYFQADAQERVMRRLQYGLQPGGLLFLGSSESLGALQPDFRVIDSGNKLYRLVRPVLATQALHGPGEVRSATLTSQRVNDRGPQRASVLNSVDGALQALLGAYLPVSLLITPQRQLLHAWGPTERFLRMPGGQPNLDAIRMLPPRLGAVVSHAMQRALRERQPYRPPPLMMEQDNERLHLQVVARPVLQDQSEPCVVVSIEQLPAAPPASVSERPLDGQELDRLAALERELADSRVTLQTSIEELEAANEELQATNEELMSANEELQSTNEELQSVNEELYTVNAEYNGKLDLVNALHADLEGMSQSTGIATLFVDHQLELVRFTPEATLLFRLRPTDVGRSIADFKCPLDYPELVDDLREALAGQPLRERELNGPNQARYLARVLGYGEGGSGSRRAVLSLIDVSRMHDAERLQRLIDSLPQHIAVLDERGNILQVNLAWQRFARQNGAASGTPRAASTGVGANYLGVLARSTDVNARELLTAT